MKKITLLLSFIVGLSMFGQNVIVDQVPDAAIGLIVSFQGNDTNGVYSADDFTLTTSTLLGEMDFEGNLSNLLNFSNLVGFNIFIYEDEGGLPAGNPLLPGTALVELTDIPPSLFTLEEDGAGIANFIAVQITEANGGVQITLEPGTYWITAFPTVDEAFAVTGANRWNWAGSTTDVSGPTEPVLIDPNDNFGAGATNWSNIPGLVAASFPGLVFQIRDEEVLSTEDNLLTENISIFPNPTNGDLNLNVNRSFGELDVNIVNVNGQVVMNRTVDTIGSTTLSTSSLANGVYFAQISSDEGSTTLKFIKN